MANTTSGTTTFDKTFAIDEIIEDAFERIGLNSVAGYQLKSARRSLNILFQEWGNRGIHYWVIGSTNLDLIEGQADYDFFRSSGDGTSATTTDPASVFGVSDVLEALCLEIFLQILIDNQKHFVTQYVQKILQLSHQ